jgi:hypothetical protein
MSQAHSKTKICRYALLKPFQMKEGLRSWFFKRDEDHNMDDNKIVNFQLRQAT